MTFDNNCLNPEIMRVHLLVWETIADMRYLDGFGVIGKSISYKYIEHYQL